MLGTTIDLACFSDFAASSHDESGANITPHLFN
jgi:hypothetical protein